jgi:hypothetical protein
VQQEAQQQAADQVSIGNSIGSLRALSAIDWKQFVETPAWSSRRCGQDPAGVYRRMDFATRDRYRHAVEALARRSELEEPDVARARSSSRAMPRPEEDEGARRHVGYWLVDAGVPVLERQRTCARAAGTRPAAAGRAPRLGRLPWRRWRRSPPCSPGRCCGWCRTPACGSRRSGWRRWRWRSRPASCAGAGQPGRHAARAPASCCRAWIIRRASRSRRARWWWCRPMLGDVAGAEALVEALEVRYLANRGANLYFGLLTDLPDAAQEQLPGDEAVLARAAAGIEDLNRRYATEDEDRFFLFHRPRRWNSGSAAGWATSASAGKLGELNALLRGSGWERFSRVVGDIGVLAGVRYVITLDTDTLLPRDSAAELVGTMEHPLNRPRRDPDTGLVCGGYGILQPRVGISLASGPRTPYARLFGSDAGIDPYTRAVSDLYQDAFAEGSFIGKGIYDVDAFEGALAGRFPDDAILSHDLVEGCHARSGLVTDVQLYEDIPASCQRRQPPRALDPRRLAAAALAADEGTHAQRQWRRNHLGGAVRAGRSSTTWRRRLVPPARCWGLLLFGMVGCMPAWPLDAGAAP